MTGDVIDIMWLVNGSLSYNLPVRRHFDLEAGLGLLTITDIIPAYNNTRIACAVEFTGADSIYASSVRTLQIQG